MAEWFKAHAWKACVGNTTGGSNPPLSARSLCGIFHFPAGNDSHNSANLSSWISSLSDESSPFARPFLDVFYLSGGSGLGGRADKELAERLCWKINFCSVNASSSALKGFQMNASPFMTKSLSHCPLINMTGMRAVEGFDFRATRTSAPPIPGIRMSQRTASGISAPTNSIPLKPEVATWTS